jgi:hypothetical protein
MFRTTHTISRTAAGLALVAALTGISVSSALGSSPPRNEYATWLAGPRAHRTVVSQRLVLLASVGLAQGVLETRFGFSPARAESWTTGVCSYGDRPPSCYLSPAQARATALAEARSLGADRDRHDLPHA